MKLFYRLAAKLTGKNPESAPKALIIDQMSEPRPLPMGKAEFNEWSSRIISGALLAGGKEDPEAFHQSQRFALANMLLHLGPTESHKPDAFFIHSLRRTAVNQVAFAMAEEIRAAEKARLAAKEALEAESDEPIPKINGIEKQINAVN